ncbi:MAG: hydantoinase B/oxoprolinase family protein [Rhodospirillaceae bacterium]|nr:hydantoinase B/oxoprolinase family protein [Rhodospirillaceae bacterium]
MLISPKQKKIALKTDNVFLEILNNRLNGITSEMGHIIHKASFTPFIKEAWDFGQALVSLDGEIFSYPRDVGVAFIVASLMDDAVKAFDDYKPGDIVVMNDPYTTGALCTHLPDFHLLKPYFYKGELICFSWTFIHSSDVGGMVPGSIAPAAYDIFQEGLRLPPLKLYRAGELNEDVMTIILANSRIPYHNKGDLQALVAAMNVAEKRLDDTIEKYGLENVRNGTADLLNYGEMRARDIIRQIPEGSYEVTDYLEMDITGEPPTRIKLRMDVKDGEILLDFSETDPQVRASLNLPTFGKSHHFINAGVLNFIHAVDKSVPLNRGILRPVKVHIPTGSVLNPEPFASVGIRFVSAVRVMEMIFGALSLATDGKKPAPPEVGGRAPASGSGMLGVGLLAMTDPRTNQFKVNVVQPLWGGSGGRPVKDGLDGADLPAGFLRNIPAETSEAEMPILVHKFKLAAEEAAAPGKWRGGYGIDMEFQVFTPNAMLTTRGMERCVMRPWGRKGGAYGTRARTIVNEGAPDERSIGKIIDVLHLNPNDRVRIVTPNGGGYGDPLERDPALVLRDVEDELLSPADAEKHYGVVVIGGAVDAAATKARRAERAKARPEPREFDFGPERDAFEKTFPPELQDRLNKLVWSLPAGQRQYYRVRIMAAVAKEQETNGADPARIDLAQMLERCRSEVAAAILK